MHYYIFTFSYIPMSLKESRKWSPQPEGQAQLPVLAQPPGLPQPPVLAQKWNPQASGLAQLLGLAPKYSRLRLYFGA